MTVLLLSCILFAACKKEGNLEDEMSTNKLSLESNHVSDYKNIHKSSLSDIIQFYKDKKTANSEFESLTPNWNRALSKETTDYTIRFQYIRWVPALFVLMVWIPYDYILNHFAHTFFQKLVSFLLLYALWLGVNFFFGCDDGIL